MLFPTKISALAFVSIFFFSLKSFAANDLNPDVNQLMDLKLGEILKRKDIKVTSVSKRAENVFGSAAAVYVISQDDIRRSGSTSIAEALRLAPGVQVNQISSNKWSVSIRGFSDQLAKKLLVLIDGRSVYTPLFAGVNWDEQDVVMEDIDRIEIIRGSGGTLWGANAVNGVINIITKTASETSSNLISAKAGNYERLGVSARHGGKISDNTFFRVYGKYFEKDSTKALNKSFDNNDDWNDGRSGFRVDSEKNSYGNITVQGDIYNGVQDRAVVLPVSGGSNFKYLTDEERAGGNLLTRWNYDFSNNSNVILQVYYDKVIRNNDTLQQDRDTIDFDFQNNIRLNSSNKFIWGVGYRYVADALDGTTYINFTPSSRESNLLSSFIQNETELVENKLYLTYGSKFEDNDYTGFEYQPNIRASYHINDSQTLWAAVSRAVRTPSRAESDIRLVINETGPFLVRQIGHKDFESEEMVSYELGHRIVPMEGLSVDSSVYYNDYDKLLTLEGTLPNLYANNLARGKVYGAEISSEYQINSKWVIGGNVSLSRTIINNYASSTDTLASAAEGKDARTIVSLNSRYDITNNLEINNYLYFMDGIFFSDSLPKYGIDSTTRFDTSVNWRPSEGMELSLVGQNLLDSHHQEWKKPLESQNASEIGRSLYGKVTFRF